MVHTKTLKNVFTFSAIFHTCSNIFAWPNSYFTFGWSDITLFVKLQVITVLKNIGVLKSLLINIKTDAQSPFM